MASSSEDSSGVPQRRHITAEQSPHVNGSVTSFAQTGQYITTDGCFAADAGFGAISMSTDCNTIFGQKFVRVTSRLVFRLAQDQVSRSGGKRKGKLPDLVLHPDPEKKILVLLPRADPFIAGREKHPAMRF